MKSHRLLALVTLSGLTILLGEGVARSIACDPDDFATCQDIHSDRVTALEVTAAADGIEVDSLGVGVSSTSANSVAVSGVSTTNIGVTGSSTYGTGVSAYSGASNGVEAISGAAGASGVYGHNYSGSGYGVAGRITFGNNPNTGIAIYGDNASATGYAGYFNGRVSVQGNITATGTITSGSSDARLKKDVKPLAGALDRLLQLRGVTFQWKDPAQHGDQRGVQRGFIAQDVEKVMPEWIGKDDKGWKTVAIPGRGLEAMMVESIRTLKTQNDELRQRVEALERQVAASAGRLATAAR